MSRVFGKRFCIAILSAAASTATLCLGQSAEYNRKYEFYEDLSGLIVPRAIDFYSGERVELTVTVMRNGEEIDLSGAGMSSRWGIVDRSAESNQVVLVVTGDMSSASSGVIQFVIMPDESQITNMLYEGYIVVEKSSGGSVVERGTVQRQSVNVRRSQN